MDKKQPDILERADVYKEQIRKTDFFVTTNGNNEIVTN